MLKKIVAFSAGHSAFPDIGPDIREKRPNFLPDICWSDTQCCGSEMIYSGSSSEFSEFRIRSQAKVQPMLFKYLYLEIVNKPP